MYVFRLAIHVVFLCLLIVSFTRFQEGPDAISVAQLRTRTTSSIESYNGRIGQKIASHSKFFMFASLLRREEAVTLLDFRQMLESGGSSREKYHRKNPRIAERHNAIDEVTELLMSKSCTYMDFLSRVAYAPANRALVVDFNVSDISEADLLPVGEVPLVAPVAVPSVLGRVISRGRKANGRGSRRGRGASTVSAPTSLVGVAGTSASLLAVAGTSASLLCLNRGGGTRNRGTSRLTRANHRVTSTITFPTTAPSRRSSSNSLDDFELPAPMPNVPAAARSIPNNTQNTNTATVARRQIIQITLPAPAFPHRENAIVDNSLCICCDERRSVRFSCGHCVFCSECYDKHVSYAMAKFQVLINSPRRRGDPEPALEILCPMCREKITATTLVFLI